MTHLLLTNQRVVANVVRVLAGRLRHLTALVEDLSFHHITQRVARLLLEESAGTDGAVTLTHQTMAARVGTAREVVSRALGELEDRSAIKRERNRIVQVNVAMLRALLEQGAAERPSP